MRPRVIQKEIIYGANLGRTPGTFSTLFLWSLEELFCVPMELVVCTNIYDIYVVDTVGNLLPDVPYDKLLLFSKILCGGLVFVGYNSCTPSLMTFCKGRLNIHVVTAIYKGVVAHMWGCGGLSVRVGDPIKESFVLSCDEDAFLHPSAWLIDWPLPYQEWSSSRLIL